MTTLTLTADQAGVLHEVLDDAIQAEIDRPLGEAIQLQEKLRPQFELGKQLLAIDLEAGGELAIADTAAALRVVRDLIASRDATMRDDVCGLLDGPGCAEDQAEWEKYARQHGVLLARDSRVRQLRCELLVELSVRRAAEVERIAHDEVVAGLRMIGDG